MKRLLAWVLAAAAMVAAAPAQNKPKLLLAIAVDQFRYDYLTRFRSEYTAGFDRLLTKGAVFTSARFEHFPTVTAIGHSTFLSGATPSISGIVGNDWYDREARKVVTSVSDDEAKLVGGGIAAGASPRRLLVSTVGDELKMANGKSRVIGISLKDRAAILPAGHMADGAYWFDTQSGNFVSSTYYFPQLPGWVQDFNKSRPADKYCGAKWLNRTMPAEPRKLYGDLAPSPFGNELIEAFAERAIEAEQLGRHEVTDLLAISFSSNDYVGHSLGPDSAEVHEMAVRTDKLLGQLFGFVDEKVGMQNVLVVLTADHGVSPLPEVNQARKMPGGRMPEGIVKDTVEQALTAKYGPGKWVVSPGEHSLYLNLDLIAEKKLDRVEVSQAAAAAALKLPHVFRVYTRDRLMNGEALEDQVGRRVMNGFYIRRGADVFILLEPYWMFSAKGTTHGTTFSYDAHVPVIFMGPGIRAGRFRQPIAPNDIAPTLAEILSVETPSGSVGRVLSEILLQ